jgi:hypothetical protein
VRIIENTPSYLRLQETSGRLPAILLGAAVIIAVAVVYSGSDLRQLVNAVLFAGSAVFFRRISRVELAKAGRTARIFRVDMWKRSDRAIPFDDISDVRVEVMRPDTSVQCHTRLTLTTGAGPVPLTAGFRANLDDHIALRETMVDVIFSGRTRPAPLSAVEVLTEGGRPLLAAMRGDSASSAPALVR